MITCAACNNHHQSSSSSCSSATVARTAKFANHGNELVLSLSLALFRCSHTHKTPYSILLTDGWTVHPSTPRGYSARRPDLVLLAPLVLTTDWLIWLLAAGWCRKADWYWCWCWCWESHKTRQSLRVVSATNTCVHHDQPLHTADRTERSDVKSLRAAGPVRFVYLSRVYLYTFRLAQLTVTRARAAHVCLYGCVCVCVCARVYHHYTLSAATLFTSRPQHKRRARAAQRLLPSVVAADSSTFLYVVYLHSVPTYLPNIYRYYICGSVRSSTNDDGGGGGVAIAKCACSRSHAASSCFSKRF